MKLSITNFLLCALVVLGDLGEPDVRSRSQLQRGGFNGGNIASKGGLSQSKSYNGKSSGRGGSSNARNGRNSFSNDGDYGNSGRGGSSGVKSARNSRAASRENAYDLDNMDAFGDDGLSQRAYSDYSDMDSNPFAEPFGRGGRDDTNYDGLGEMFKENDNGRRGGSSSSRDNRTGGKSKGSGFLSFFSRNKKPQTSDRDAPTPSQKSKGGFSSFFSRNKKADTDETSTPAGRSRRGSDATATKSKGLFGGFFNRNKKTDSANEEPTPRGSRDSSSNSGAADTKPKSSTSFWARRLRFWSKQDKEVDGDLKAKGVAKNVQKGASGSSKSSSSSGKGSSKTSSSGRGNSKSSSSGRGNSGRGSSRGRKSRA